MLIVDEVELLHEASISSSLERLVEDFVEEFLEHGDDNLLLFEDEVVHDKLEQFFEDGHGEFVEIFGGEGGQQLVFEPLVEEVEAFLRNEVGVIFDEPLSLFEVGNVEDADEDFRIAGD